RSTERARSTGPRSCPSARYTSPPRVHNHPLLSCTESRSVQPDQIEPWPEVGAAYWRNDNASAFVPDEAEHSRRPWPSDNPCTWQGPVAESARSDLLARHRLHSLAATSSISCGARDVSDGEPSCRLSPPRGHDVPYPCPGQ